MNDDLQTVYQKDSSLTFISGDLGSGKTDMALLLMEKGRAKGIFSHIASNVDTYNNPDIDHICYFDRLEKWLHLPGSKAYLLDELGINLYRLSFMSQQSKLILKTIQLVRKFRCHFFGIAPNEEYVNKHFYHLMEVHIKKVSLKTAIIDNYHTKQSYPVFNIPRTKLKFRTRDVATFGLTDPVVTELDWSKQAEWEKAWKLYLVLRNVRKVGFQLDCSPMQVTRLLNKAVKELKVKVVTK